MHLSEDAIIGVFITHTQFCRWPRTQLNQLNLKAEGPSAAKAENEQSGETYL